MLSQSFIHKQLLYAQSCPEQPLILQKTIITEEPFNFKAKRPFKQSRSKMFYQPHIIPTKKRRQNSVKPYDEKQHERELSILQTRIRNCKSLSQRKKDHNDPILYPTYFILEKKRCKDARIDVYFRRVVEGREKKQPKRSSPRRRMKKELAIKQQQEEEITRQSFWKMHEQGHQRFARSNYPLPPVTHQETRHRASLPQMSTLNLPSGDSQSIAAFIIDRRLFLQGELKILKARLFHNYGDSVEQQWRAAMQWVLRHKPT